MAKQISLFLLLFLCISNLSVAKKLDSLDVSVSIFRGFDLSNSFYHYKTADMEGRTRLKSTGGELIVGTRSFGVGVSYERIRNTFYREAIPPLSLTVPEMVNGGIAGLFVEFYPVNRNRLKLSIRVGPIYGKADYLHCIYVSASYEGPHITDIQQLYVLHRKHNMGLNFGINASYRVYNQLFITLNGRFYDYKRNDDWEYMNQNDMPVTVMVSLGVGYKFK